MTSLVKDFFALVHASKFLRFINGSEITLSDGTKATLKVKGSDRLPRRPGLRLSKYLFRTEVQSGDVIESGCGEDDSKLLAYEKSLAEAVERVIFRLMKNKGVGTETTSGWAAHISKDKARKAALEELSERDAIMVHWLLKKPMIEIDPKSFPYWLKQWVKNELSLHPILKRLRVLVTLDGWSPTVTSILMTDQGRGVLSHACANTLTMTLRKAMTETCRLATNIDHKNFYESSHDLLLDKVSKINPEDHGMLYAYHSVLPDWIFGDIQPWGKIKKEWIEAKRKEPPPEQFTFYEVVEAPLSVGFVKSNAVQDLYFGSTKEALRSGKINFNRLNIGGVASGLNLAPHFIS